METLPFSVRAPFPHRRFGSTPREPAVSNFRSFENFMQAITSARLDIQLLSEERICRMRYKEMLDIF